MTTQETRNEIHDLMTKSDAVYVSTVLDDGFPLTRAMLNLRDPRKFPGLAGFMKTRKELFFTTNTSLPKTAQIAANPKVCAYFCLPAEWRAVAVQGTMTIVTGKALKKELWQDGWTMYYPGGVEDPEYTVLMLTPLKIKGYRQLSHYTMDPSSL